MVPSFPFGFYANGRHDLKFQKKKMLPNGIGIERDSERGSDRETETKTGRQLQWARLHLVEWQAAVVSAP